MFSLHKTYKNTPSYTIIFIFYFRVNGGLRPGCNEFYTIIVGSIVNELSSVVSLLYIIVFPNTLSDRAARIRGFPRDFGKINLGIWGAWRVLGGFILKAFSQILRSLNVVLSM